MTDGVKIEQSAFGRLEGRVLQQMYSTHSECKYSTNTSLIRYKKKQMKGSLRTHTSQKIYKSDEGFAEEGVRYNDGLADTRVRGKRGFVTNPFYFSTSF